MPTGRLAAGAGGWPRGGPARAGRPAAAGWPRRRSGRGSGPRRAARRRSTTAAPTPTPRRRPVEERNRRRPVSGCSTRWSGSWPGGRPRRWPRSWRRSPAGGRRTRSPPRCGGAPAATRSSSVSWPACRPSSHPPTGGADPVLDDRARAAYRARLAELDAGIDQADADHDPHRADRANAEREALLQELSSAVGLGGRPRRRGRTGRSRLTTQMATTTRLPTAPSASHHRGARKGDRPPDELRAGDHHEERQVLAAVAPDGRRRGEVDHARGDGRRPKLARWTRAPGAGHRSRTATAGGDWCGARRRSCRRVDRGVAQSCQEGARPPSSQRREPGWRDAPVLPTVRVTHHSRAGRPRADPFDSARRHRDPGAALLSAASLLAVSRGRW